MRSRQCPSLVGTQSARRLIRRARRWNSDLGRNPLTRTFFLPRLVETMGLEPTTPCLQSRCSSHLSYVPWPGVLSLNPV